MLILNGLGPQESALNGYPRTYDHPYFGQLFLAGALGITGFPYLWNPNADVISIETLHHGPRILMGILSIIDTFIIFKISERRYDRNVAVISALLFALMPTTWILRRVYLDNLQMPLILSGILFALYMKPRVVDEINQWRSKFSISKPILALLSGIFIGLSIYTKIPAFTLMPLVGSIVFFNSGKRLRVLGIWLIPVLLIPILWPLYSVVVGQSDLWVHWVLWQTDRNRPLSSTLLQIFQIDPVIVIIGLAGILFASWRKDFFTLLWIAPFLIFSYFIGWVQYFHLITIFPAFCIGGAILIDLLRKTVKKYVSTALSLTIPAAFCIFGFLVTSMLISTDVNSNYYEVYASIAKNLPATINTNSSVTVIGSHWWIWNSYWITQLVLHDYHDILDPHFDPHFKKQINTTKVLFIADNKFLKDFSQNIKTKNYQNIKNLFEESKIVANITDNVTSKNNGQYPYNIMSIMILNENHPTGQVQIRKNY
jgi:Dolichyl-phosphate-mannose-protein mannosyltransferase